MRRAGNVAATGMTKAFESIHWNLVGVLASREHEYAGDPLRQRQVKTTCDSRQTIHVDARPSTTSIPRADPGSHSTVARVWSSIDAINGWASKVTPSGTVMAVIPWVNHHWRHIDPPGACK